MGARYDTLQKPLPNSENALKLHRILANEEIKTLCKVLEEKRLNVELRRFEKQLYDFRPKFRDRKICTKTILTDYGNKSWCGASNNLLLSLNSEKSCNKFTPNISKTMIINEEVSDVSLTGDIKITIKDKPILDFKKEDNDILRRCLKALQENAQESKCLRKLKVKVQEHLINILLGRYFTAWKHWTENIKKVANKKKESKNMSYERKIEFFVNAIINKQEELSEMRNTKKKVVTRVKSAPEIEKWSPISTRTINLTESPAQCRLKAQKKIIEMQKMKLNEQKRIIEEMRLKEIENDTRNESNKAMDITKAVFNHCGPNTRRTLMYFMREKGYSGKSLLRPLRVFSPPAFLLRMEARTETKKERIIKTEEACKKMLEKQTKTEELTKKGAKEIMRLQQKAQQKAKRFREEQKKLKVQELSRFKCMIEKIDRFYQRYLLRKYIVEVFLKLLATKKNLMQQANDYYQSKICAKILTVWRQYMNENNVVKLHLAISMYNKNLLHNVLLHWKLYTLEERQKYQVAIDFFDMKIQNKILKIWEIKITEMRTDNFLKDQKISEYYNKRVRIKYFKKWKNYSKIATEIRESERRKEKLRVVVQKVFTTLNPRKGL